MTPPLPKKKQKTKKTGRTLWTIRVALIAKINKWTNSSSLDSARRSRKWFKWKTPGSFVLDWKVGCSRVVWLTRLWIVILIDGRKLLDEIMVFRAYTNAINYVLGKTPVRHLELSSKQRGGCCRSARMRRKRRRRTCVSALWTAPWLLQNKSRL